MLCQKAVNAVAVNEAELWGGVWEVGGISSDKVTFEQRSDGADRAAFWGENDQEEGEAGIKSPRQ